MDVGVVVGVVAAVAVEEEDERRDMLQTKASSVYRYPDLFRDTNSPMLCCCPVGCYIMTLGACIAPEE